MIGLVPYRVWHDRWHLCIIRCARKDPKNNESECNCYGAGASGECCKTCQDVRVAYRRKGWKFNPSGISTVSTINAMFFFEWSHHFPCHKLEKTQFCSKRVHPSNPRSVDLTRCRWVSLTEKEILGVCFFNSDLVDPNFGIIAQPWLVS